MGTQRGYSLVELLVSLVIFSGTIAGVAGMLVENSRINKSEQMRVEAQANARNTLSLLVRRLRTAGWDPVDTGLSPVITDANLADAVSELEIFADLNADGDIDDEGESVKIRHSGLDVEWRTSAAGSFVPVATNVSNDADGNGSPEPMFVPGGGSPPTRITVRVTAESPVDDPKLGEPYRYTVESEVTLRVNL